MIIETTTIQTFLQCIRGMQCSFRKHWQPENSNIHLIFGISWHEAEELTPPPPPPNPKEYAGGGGGFPDIIQGLSVVRNSARSKWPLRRRKIRRRNRTPVNYTG